MTSRLNVVQRGCIKAYMREIRLALDCIETIIETNKYEMHAPEVDANVVPVEIKPDGELA